MLFKTYGDVIDELVLENGTFDNIEKLRETVARYDRKPSQLFRYAISRGEALVRMGESSAAPKIEAGHERYSRLNAHMRSELIV